MEASIFSRVVIIFWKGLQYCSYMRPSDGSVHQGAAENLGFDFEGFLFVCLMEGDISLL